MKSIVAQGIVFVAEVKKFKGPLCVFLLNLVSHNSDSSGQPELHKSQKKPPLTVNLNNF